MFDSNHLHGTANRLYYACFYAVCALLAKFEMSSSKHSGVMSLFNQHFVKPNKMPVSFGKFYSKVYNNRTEGDYGDILSEIEITQEDLAMARDFIECISSFVKA